MAPKSNSSKLSAQKIKRPKILLLKISGYTVLYMHTVPHLVSQQSGGTVMECVTRFSRTGPNYPTSTTEHGYHFGIPTVHQFLLCMLYIQHNKVTETFNINWTL